MFDDLSLKEIQKQWHGTFKSYAIGFVSSLLLTAASFCLVISDLLPRHFLICTLIALAVLQAIIQLIFFLHLGGDEEKPRWASYAFCFTALILIIIVIGSLWVMNDLNDRMMPDMTTMSFKSVDGESQI